MAKKTEEKIEAPTLEVAPAEYESTRDQARRCVVEATSERETLEAELQAATNRVEDAQARYLETEDPADWARVGELEREQNRLRFLHGKRVRAQAEAEALLEQAERLNARECLVLATKKLAGQEADIESLFGDVRAAYARLLELQRTAVQKAAEMNTTVRVANEFAERGRVDGTAGHIYSEPYIAARLQYEIFRAGEAGGVRHQRIADSLRLHIDPHFIRDALAQAVGETIYAGVPEMPGLEGQLRLLLAGPGVLTADVLPRMKERMAREEASRREYDAREKAREHQELEKRRQRLHRSTLDNPDSVTFADGRHFGHG